MKIVAISDNHRDLDVLHKIIYTTKADLYLHAGDSCVPQQLIFPFVSVRGNNDFHDYPPYRIIEAQNYRIFLTHGHFYTVARLIRSARHYDCKIVISGHTHVPKVEKHNDIYLINPGSVSRPRGGSQPSYAVININDNKIDVKIIEV